MTVCVSDQMMSSRNIINSHNFSDKVNDLVTHSLVSRMSIHQVYKNACNYLIIETVIATSHLDSHRKKNEQVIRNHVCVTYILYAEETYTIFVFGYGM